MLMPRPDDFSEIELCDRCGAVFDDACRSRALREAAREPALPAETRPS